MQLGNGQGKGRVSSRIQLKEKLREQIKLKGKYYVMLLKKFFIQLRFTGRQCSISGIMVKFSGMQPAM